MRKYDSAVLRNIATHFLQNLGTAVLETEHQDLITSILRQWRTCDGRAGLYLGDRLVHLHILGESPDGKSLNVATGGDAGPVQALQRIYKIKPEDLPTVTAQLNRCQSAEVTNADGLLLRVRYDPKIHAQAVEPLVPVPAGPPSKRDYHTIARDVLKDEWSSEASAEDLDGLVDSVANQWQHHNGHACLFAPKEQLNLTLTELADGGSHVGTKREPFDLKELLVTQGLGEDIIPRVIDGINCGIPVGFRDRFGRDVVLTCDPERQRFNAQLLPRDPSLGPQPTVNSCPHCRIFLVHAPEMEPPKFCPSCGLAIRQ